MATEITRDKNGGMVYKKTDPVKKKAGRKPDVHKCSEKVQLERMRMILVGNGDPKTGLAFKMEESIQDIATIKNDITDIKTQLKETIAAASTAASSLEKYKLEVKSFENGKNDAEEKRNIADALKKKEAKEEEEKQARDRSEKWQRIFWIIMAVIALSGLGVSIYFNVKGNAAQITTIEKVDNLGTPVIIDSTGTIMNTRAAIKMWPKDFDSVNKDTTLYKK
jgi:hypothetical protein